MKGRRVEHTSASGPITGAAAQAGAVSAQALLLNITDAAALVGVSRWTVRRMLAAGHFPRPARYPGLRGLRFRRADVEEWAKGGKPG